MKRDRHSTIVLLPLIAILALLLILIGCPRQLERERATTTTTQEEAGAAFPQTISGLNQPIAIAFAPDRRIFITERIGQVRIFENGRLREEPFATVDVPELPGYHETGLLGIALHPNFQAQPYVYVYHSYSQGGRLFNRVVRFRDNTNRAQSSEIIIDRIPGGRIHDGGIILFGPDGNLYVGTGDSGNSELAQNKSSLAGKVLRVEPDGSIPPDNPFGNAVFSIGHRNIFGMAFNLTNKALYITENGPIGNDEVNKVESGKNYGWPEALGESDDPRFANPVIVYRTTIAPTQAIFYTGDIFSQIKDNFVFGTYVTQELHALELTSRGLDRVRRDKVVFNSSEPIIGVAQSPDGAIYITDGNSVRRIDRLEN